MLMITDAVASALGAGVGGVVSGIASLFGADAQSRNVRRTNEMNYKIAQETNANQLQIARENNQLQLDAMRENNAFNKQSAIDMFNLEAAYNSPQAAKERLLAAGINPATLYGQGGSVGGSVNASTPSASSSGISPSMPNFVTPTMQTPPSVLNGMFGNIEMLSRSLGNVAKAGLDLVTKRKISATLQAEIDKIVADTENVKIQNQWNAFKMQLDKENLPRKQAKEIEQIMSQIFKDYATGGAAHASIALQEAQTKLSGQEFEKIREQRPWLLANIKKLGDLYDEQADTERTKQDYNQAEAAYKRTLSANVAEDTKWLADTHEARVNIVKNQRDLSDSEVYKTKRTIEQQVEYILNQTWLSDRQKELLDQQITAARKSNDWYDWQQTAATIESITRSADNISGAFLPWKKKPSNRVSETWNEQGHSYSHSYEY